MGRATLNDSEYFGGESSNLSKKGCSPGKQKEESLCNIYVTGEHQLMGNMTLKYMEFHKLIILTWEPFLYSRLLE